jgi:hypothetical protein
MSPRPHEMIKQNKAHSPLSKVTIVFLVFVGNIKQQNHDSSNEIDQPQNR